MKRLILPVIAAAFLLGASGAATAAPERHHAHAQVKHTAKPAARARASKATRRANRATVHARKSTARANRATAHARKATVRANRATAHARRATAHARRTTIRNNRDLARWRGAVRAQHRYRWNTWHRPRGWNYRRWYVGGYMPRTWYARDYWITNYLALSLLAPPPDYEWIRQGPDAVLVDINTGAVLRVEYDVFY